MNFYGRVRRKLLDFRFALVIMLQIFWQTTWIDFCRIYRTLLSEMKSAQSVNNKVIKIKSQAHSHEDPCERHETSLWEKSEDGIKPVVAPSHVRIFVRIGFVFHLLEITYYIFFSYPALFRPELGTSHSYIWLLGFWYWFQLLYDIASDFRDFTQSIYR